MIKRFDISLLALVAMFAAADSPHVRGDDSLRLDSYGDPLPKAAVARLGTLRFRSSSLTVGAAFSPDNSELITWDRQSCVRVWRLPTGERVRQFRFPKCDSLAFALSPDATLLAAPEEDGDVCLYDLRSGDLVLRLSGHSEAVRKVAFTDNSKLLASATWGWEERDEKMLRLWKLPKGELWKTIGLPDKVTLDLVFGPGTNRLFSCGGETFLGPGTIRRWDFDKSDEPETVAPTKFAFNRGQFAHGGKLLTYGGGARTFVGIDPHTGVERISIETGASRDGVVLNDGRRVATLTREGQLTIWSLEDGRQLDQKQLPRQLYGSMNCSRDDQWIAYSELNAVHVVNLETGRDLFPNDEPISAIANLALSQDGRYIAAKSRDPAAHMGVRLWARTKEGS